MSQHPAFRRTIVIMAIAFSPFVFLWSVDSAKSAPKKIQEPCQISIYGPTYFRGYVGYTAGAYCPGARVIKWKLTINRSGLPWASRSGVITSLPRVSKKCVRKGPPVTLRPIFKIKAFYSPYLTHTRTVRGKVVSVRCAGR